LLRAAAVATAADMPVASKATSVRAGTSVRASTPGSGAARPSDRQRGGKRPAATSKAKAKTSVITESKWHIDSWQAEPASCITNEELEHARKKFFDVDIDGSGSIDIDELAAMLRSLGKDPTDAEVAEMMSKADGGTHGDGDGRISLREWLGWYAMTLRHKRDNDSEDMLDAFLALGGSKDKSDGVPKDEVAAMLKRDFDLHVNVDAVFDVEQTGTQLTLEEFSMNRRPQGSAFVTSDE